MSENNELCNIDKKYSIEELNAELFKDDFLIIENYVFKTILDIIGKKSLILKIELIKEHIALGWHKFSYKISIISIDGKQLIDFIILPIGQGYEKDSIILTNDMNLSEFKGKTLSEIDTYLNIFKI